MKMGKTTKALLALFVIFQGGCSSLGSNGPSDDALAGKPEAMWTDGQKAVRDGEKLIANGESKVSEGNDQVRKGENMISEGDLTSKNARADYQALSRRAGTSTTPKEVASEAKRLKAVSGEWEDSIEMIKDGNSLISKGNKNIERGQSEIRQGRVLMESGSTLMQNSKRSDS